MIDSCRYRLATLLARVAAVAVLIGSPAHAQGTRADYERAETLRARTRGKVFKAQVAARWLPGNERLWYRNDLPEGRREFVIVDAKGGTKAPAFDHERMAKALTEALGRPVEAAKLPIEGLEWPEEGSSVRLRAGGKSWTCDLESYAIEAAEEKPTPREGRGDAPLASRRTGEESEVVVVNRTERPIRLFWLDPEGAPHPYGAVAPGQELRQHTFGGHVWSARDETGRELDRFEAEDQPIVVEVGPDTAPRPDRVDRAQRRRRPGSGSPDGKWATFVRDHDLFLRAVGSGEESVLGEGGNEDDRYEPRVWWSPDSRYVVAMQVKQAPERQVTVVESSPRDQLQPRVHTYGYRKPGDPIPKPRPRLFDVENRKEVPIDEALFPEPWSLDEMHWARDSSRFSFLYNQRGHQVLRVVSVEASTGQARAIVDEQSSTFVDYADKTFLHHLDATDELIWMSERSGWNHLYLIDAKTGAVKNPITTGEWLVRGVERVDEERREVWFRLAGIDPDQDPYHVHFARVKLDGSGLVRLTRGDGTHDVQYSPDRRFYLDRYSRVDQPPITELRRAEDGELAVELERADTSALLAAGWRAPERFTAKGRDGKTDIHGVIFRPTNFDESKRYPVIEQIYAGPQGAFVPKSFAPYFNTQGLAELGFVVVQIDGMGTNWRSKAFHDVCWKNLADSGLPDRVAWIQAAAAKYPQLDTSQVGIYGGSAGGQNALSALLSHGDFYKAAAADCGCHDNRMDKIWWNELWMGWPIGPHYAEQSNVTRAHELQGKLLLIVGELDHNVDPASTMQVVNALIRANKDFDLLVVPGADHGAGGSPYGVRRQRDFFVRHLLKVEPRSE